MGNTVQSEIHNLKPSLKNSWKWTTRSYRRSKIWHLLRSLQWWGPCCAARRSKAAAASVDLRRNLASQDILERSLHERYISGEGITTLSWNEGASILHVPRRAGKERHGNDQEIEAPGVHGYMNVLHSTFGQENPADKCISCNVSVVEPLSDQCTGTSNSSATAQWACVFVRHMRTCYCCCWRSSISRVRQHTVPCGLIHDNWLRRNVWERRKMWNTYVQLEGRCADTTDFDGIYFMGDVVGTEKEGSVLVKYIRPVQLEGRYNWPAIEDILDTPVDDMSTEEIDVVHHHFLKRTKD